MAQDEKTEPSPGMDAQATPQPPVEQPGSGSVSEPAPESESESEPKLPPLTPQEFRVYNRLAEKMEYFVCTLHTSRSSPWACADPARHSCCKLTNHMLNRSTSISGRCTSHCTRPVSASGAPPA
jgi:hypothetical protein